MKKKTMLELHRVDAEQYSHIEKLPITVVLDNVRSEMNVGSVFRTADAFLIERICLCGITAVPPKPEIHKTALGAENTVPWTHYASAAEAIAQLRQQGYRICAVEQVHGSISLERFSPEPGQRLAIILGNEVKGVSQEAVDASDCCIEIPQYGTKHSLNIANTAAIVMWHLSSHILL
ncbi:MAG: RNA methyltransferase [Muribaculaceae bacterium]|nr:RNA methyltransferase [Muribaculaceae bacterium]MBR1726873.1 RNA methyltransferase [Muribaculaceae bacterium]